MRALATVFVFETFSYLVLEPLAKAVEDLPVVESSVDDEPDELFIPFPLTTKEVSPPPYSRNDPEWAEFIKINKDKELTRKIKC